MLAFPVAICGIVFMAWQLNYAPFRIVLLSLVAICFFRFSLVNSQLAFADQLNWQADRELTVRLLARMDNMELTRFEGGQSRPLALVGYKKRQESKLMIKSQDRYDTIGASFYAWQGGSAERVVDLMKSMGVDYFYAASTEQQKVILAQTEAMPIWPLQGSVALVEGITVIKLSNYSESQLRSLINKKVCGFNRYAEPACRIKYRWHPNKYPRMDGIAIQSFLSDEADYLINRESIALLTNAEYTDVNIDSQGFATASIIAAPTGISTSQMAELNIVISVLGNTSMALYYRYPNDSDYTKEKMAEYYLEEGVNKLSFRIPGALLQQPLKLYPVAGGKQFSISHFSFYKVSEN
jgi:hypothetical protein